MFIPHLEVIDVDVESPALVFSQRIGELLVGFAQNAMRGILQRLPVVVSLPGPTISLLLKLVGYFGDVDLPHATHSDNGSKFSYPSSGDGYK